jgi:hypothetical protein
LNVAVDVRKGMPPVELDRGEFEKRYRRGYADPVFKPLRKELNAIISAAWDAYSNSRKSPNTRKAGAGFADPDYDIAIDWLEAKAAIDDAQKRHDDTNGKPRLRRRRKSGSVIDARQEGDGSERARTERVALPQAFKGPPFRRCLARG